MEGRQAVRVNPDIVKAEAIAKVERLQKALDALGGLGGPEKSRCHQESSKRNDPSQNLSRSASQS